MPQLCLDATPTIHRTRALMPKAPKLAPHRRRRPDRPVRRSRQPATDNSPTRQHDAALEFINGVEHNGA